MTYKSFTLKLLMSKDFKLWTRWIIKQTKKECLSIKLFPRSNLPTPTTNKHRPKLNSKQLNLKNHQIASNLLMSPTFNIAAKDQAINTSLQSLYIIMANNKEAQKLLTIENVKMVWWVIINYNQQVCIKEYMIREIRSVLVMVCSNSRIRVRVRLIIKQGIYSHSTIKIEIWKSKDV